MSDMTIIKQYGDAKTGTTITLRAIEQAFQKVCCLRGTLGMKHVIQISPPVWEPEDWYAHRPRVARSMSENILALHGLDLGAVRRAYEQAAIRYVICCKNPWATYVSQMRPQTTGQKRGLAALVNRPREVQRFVANYNLAYRRWLCLLDDAPSNGILVRNEDFRNDPEATLNTIGAQFGLERSAARSAVPEDPRRYYYNRHAYMDVFRASILRFMADLLDDELLQRLGYNPWPI